MNVRGDFLGPPHGTTTRALISYLIGVYIHQVEPCYLNMRNSFFFFFFYSIEFRAKKSEFRVV